MKLTRICWGLKHTTPSIPYMVKYVLMLVQVVMFITGRMELRLKIGRRASSKAGWFGSEQFTRKAPPTAEGSKTSPVVNMLQLIFQQNSCPVPVHVFLSCLILFYLDGYLSWQKRLTCACRKSKLCRPKSLPGISMRIRTTVGLTDGGTH